MFCFCYGLAPGSDRLAPKAGLGARALPRRATCRARAAKSARRGIGHKPGFPYPRIRSGLKRCAVKELSIILKYVSQIENITYIPGLLNRSLLRAR